MNHELITESEESLPIWEKVMADFNQSRSEDRAQATQNGDGVEGADAEKNVKQALTQGVTASPRDLADSSSSSKDLAKPILKDAENALQSQIIAHDSTNRVLAYLVTGAFFALIMLLMFSTVIMPKDVDGGVKDLLFTLLGVVATGWANIIGFYFGSSVGSAQKSQTINAALLHGNSAESLSR